ncbi:MAG: pantetheine-phosphate adenylyltransferase [Bacteroidales bacterium]|nr:pantetheine-phosphate adenylyltransferase [Bacteroidales bacterium]MDD4602634.1 pantetheine-phosphate adenylyltransferase [Bacteroidales bacterium]
MENIAVFPGSFDPITRGHESIIRRALPLFSKVIIGIGENRDKKSFFSLEQRRNWIQTIFAGERRIEILTYSGLTVTFCRSHNVRFILRGLRTAADFEFERSVGQINKLLLPEIETIFLLCAPEYASLSSSIVRDILHHGGDVKQFIPEGIDLSL